jgi:hypothetical protein
MKTGTLTGFRLIFVLMVFLAVSIRKPVSPWFSFDFKRQFSVSEPLESHAAKELASSVPGSHGSPIP